MRVNWAYGIGYHLWSNDFGYANPLIILGIGTVKEEDEGRIELKHIYFVNIVSR